MEPHAEDVRLDSHCVVKRATGRCVPAEGSRGLTQAPERCPASQPTPTATPLTVEAATRGTRSLALTLSLAHSAPALGWLRLEMEGG